MSASKFSKATVCFVCFSLIFAVALIAAFSCGIIEMPAISSEITAEAATGAATTDVLRDGEVASGYSPSGTGISNIDTARSNLKGTYYLTQNITITTLAVADNSDGVNIFSGTFDGNGKTITIKAAPEAQCTNGSIGGLFAILQGTVKNCNIVVETFCARFNSGSEWANAGIIAGAGGANAKVENEYITLKHSPTSMTNGSDNAYLSQYVNQSSKGSSMRLGGVFGNIIGNVTVTDTTVDNQTSGSYGFSTHGWRVGGSWTSHSDGFAYIGGFFGNIQSGTITATRIALAGISEAKIHAYNESADSERYNKCFVGGILGYADNGSMNINGLIVTYPVKVSDGANIFSTNGNWDCHAGLIIGYADSGNSGSWEKFYFIDNISDTWWDGGDESRGTAIKFPSAYSPRFVGTGEIAFDISTKQAPNDATKIVKTVTYSGRSYNVMESNIAHTPAEEGQTSWFTLDTVNAGGKDTMPSITITANATQSTISMTPDLTITSDSSAYRATREYNGSNVTAPKISLGDGSTGLNYSESNANKNVGTHTLTTNIDSSDYECVVYEGIKYVYHTGNGVVYTPLKTSAGDIYDIDKSYIVEVTTRNVTIGNGSATITYGDTAEAVKINNAPECTSGSLVSGERISAYNVSGYTQCAVNAGSEQSFTYSGVVILDNSDTDVSGNYNITYGDVSATVAKKTIAGNLTLDDNVFSGVEKVATFNVTSGELYKDDAVDISYSGDRINVTDEGFTATATLPKFDGTNSNYIFNDGLDYISAVFSIIPKTVTISVNSEAPTSYKYSGVWTDSRLAELFVIPKDIRGETLLLAFEITHDGAPATAVQYIGEYNIVATLLESYTNYTAVEVETTLNITAKEITVSAVSGGKTYDGQAAPVSELQALFTVKNAIDENSCADLIVNFSEGEVKDAKEYTVTVSLPEDYNKMYVLVGGLPSTKYTISPKDIAVNWGETSFEYDGTEKKPAPTADTGIEGESVMIVVIVQEGSAVNVGTYNATASQSNTNYTLTDTASEFYITAAALKDLAVGIENWAYGGTASAPSVTGNTGSGAETLTYSGTAYDGTVFTDSASAPDRAGEYTVKVSVAASGNYAAGSAQSTFEILRATLTDNTVAVKVTYDGAAHGLTIALTGFVNGDSFDTASGKVISYGTEEGIYSAEPVTVTNVIDSKTVYYKAEFHNYVTVESSRSVTVTPLTVVIDWCLNDFTYNGTAQTIAATYADVSGSNIPLTVTTYREFKNAGDYTATAAFGNGETNYALPETVTKEYSIKKLAVSVQAPSVSVQYGDSVSSLKWQYSGEARFFETVDFEVTTEATATSSVGTYSTVVTPQSFDNYDVTYSNGVLTVTKRIVTLNIEAKSSQYGDPVATLTAVLQEGSSFAATDTAETVYKLSTTATATSSVGSYNISGECINDNYTLFFNNGKSAYEIVKRKVTLSIQPATSVFGDPIAELSATEASGTLVEGDDNVYSLSTSAKNGSGVGNYNITGSVENTNYDITFVGGAGAYTITARVVTINWCKNNFTYNGSVQTVTAYYKDINNSEVALAVTIKADGRVAEFRNAGYYTATAAFANDETNYALPATVTAAYEIKKAASVIDISGVATVYTYTGEEQTVTGATLNHDETELVYSDNTFTTVEEGNGKTVTITARESANYFGASETVTITVNKLKVIKPSASVTQFVYDNTEKTLISDGERYTVAEGKATDAGDYTATVTLRDGANTEWSDGSSDPFGIPWKILQADYDMSNVSLSDMDFEYDGTAHTVTVEGELPAGLDGIKVTVSYNGATVTDVKDGRVTVTATFATESENYNVPAPMKAYISVYARTVDIVWCANDFTYNGTAQTIAATYADVSGSNIPLNVTTDREFKNAGDYTATAAFANDETNYALPDENSATYTIKELEVSVVANDAEMYYGDTPAGLGWSYAEGSAEFVETDGISLTVITDADSESAAGGNYYTRIVEVTLENYIVNYQDGVFSVAPRKITVTIDKKSSVYGDEIAELTASVTEGEIVNGDTGVYSLSTSATNTSNAGNYDITGSVLDTNYNITFEGGTNAYTIGKRAITVTIEGATSVYGDEIAELASAVTDGEIVNGDTKVYSLSTSATNSSNVGEYNINGTVNNLNYDITFEGGTYAYTITAREIAIVWCENKFTYNGGVQAVTAYYKDINNAEVALAVTVKADGAEAEFRNAGDYTATAAFAKGETNYALPATVTAAYNIAKLAVSVVADDAEMQYGSTPAGLGWSYAEGSSKFIASDNIELVVSTTADELSPVGAYETAITEAEFENYTVTYAKGVMQVVARKITVTIDKKSSAYGDEIAELASAVTDGEIVNGDTEVYSLSTSATNRSNVGNYDITGSVENANYDITFVGGKGAYTITAREIIIAWCENNFTYNGGVQTVTAYYKDINNSEVALAVTIEADGVVTEFRNAGNYTATASFAYGETNYALPEIVTKGYSIGKLAVSVIADNAEMPYGSTPANLTWRYAEGSAEFVASDNVIVEVITDATSASSVGRIYYTRIDTIVDDNYSVSYTDGVMSVIKATPVVNVNVVIPSGGLFTSSDMPDIEWTATSFGAEVSGVVEWVESALVAGTNEYNWIFTPQDTDNFNPVTEKYELTVEEVKLASISPDFIPGENKIYASDTLETLKQYLTVTGTNNDGSSVGVITEYELEGIIKSGICTITVRVGEVTATFDVTVEQVDVTGIRISVAPDKTEYVAFESFDASGMAVTAVYANGSEKVVTDYTVEGGENLLTSVTYVTVKFVDGGAEFEATVNITVKKRRVSVPVAVTGLVYNGAEQTGVGAGEYYTVTNGNGINAGYYTATVSLDDDVNTCWDDENASVEDKQIDWSIAKAIPSASVIVTPTEGLFTSSDMPSISVETSSVSGTAAWVSAELIAGTVSYEWKFTPDDTVNFEEIFGDYTLTVSAVELVSIAVTADPNKTDYEYGDSFDNTGMEVTAYYNDGNSATVTDYVVGADIIKIIGEVTITVEYGGMSAVTTINVAQRRLSVIDIVAVDRAYDGTTVVEVRGRLDSVVEGDDVTLVLYGAIDDKNVGADKTVYVKGELVGADAGNYVLSEPANATVTVYAREVEALWSNTELKYNGAPQSPSAAVETGIEGETLTLAVYGEGTSVGIYNATAVIEPADSNYALIGAETAFEIVRADGVIDVSGVRTVYTYTGEEQTVTGAVLNHGETELVYSENSFVTVAEGNGMVVTVSAAETENYLAVSVDIVITVNKADYDMSGVIFADVEFVYDGTEKTLTLGGELPDGVTYSLSENIRTEAGVTVVTATFIGDGENYNAIPDMTATLTVAKATYDMSGITFEDVTFVMDGTVRSIEISGALPDGVSVEYIGNGQSEDGVYVVTAVFTGDVNYNDIAPMTAIITINSIQVTHTDDDTAITVVVIDTPEGVHPETALVVTPARASYFEEAVGNNERVTAAYEISLLKDGEAVATEGMLTVRLLKPATASENFRLVAFDGVKVTEIEYEIDGDYVVFETDQLAEYAFIVNDQPSYTLLFIVLLAVLFLAEVLFIIWKRAKMRRDKKSPFAAAGAFLTFVAQNEITLLAVLGVAVALLGIYIIYLYIPKKKKNEESEDENPTSDGSKRAKRDPRSDKRRA